MAELAIIDFQKFAQGSVSERLAIAQQVGRAAQKMGFFYGQNLDVPQASVENTLLQSRALFNLPMAVKPHMAWQDEASNQGILASGASG